MAQAGRDASFSFRASEWSHQCCRGGPHRTPAKRTGERSRGQLSSYARVTGDVTPTSFLDGVALSNFDGFASTHLSACGIHPIGRQ